MSAPFPANAPTAEPIAAKEHAAAGGQEHAAPTEPPMTSTQSPDTTGASAPPPTTSPQAPTQGLQDPTPVSLISGDDAHNARAASAESTLTEAERAKIVKAENKDSKRLSKIIKADGKAHVQSLAKALKELANMQKTQKKASKEEITALKAHEKAITQEQKSQKAALKAQSVHDKAAAEINIAKERLDTIRVRASEATEMLHNQQNEVEKLRVDKAVADRERAAKLKELDASNGMLSTSNTMTTSPSNAANGKEQKGLFNTLKKRRT